MELLLLALLAAILATRLIWQQYRAPTQFKHAWFNDVLLNSEDLVKHARELGRSHKPDINKKRYNILRTRLQDNFQFISYAYREANSDARSKKIVSHSAQWLLDNFYIIEEQVKEIRQQFTHKQYRDLRVLKNTVLRGYPRVYVLALELVSHTDGKLDEQTLIDFVNAYQSEAKLTTAEIWSLSLMIRIALVEKIRFVCERLEAADKQWKQVQNDLERLTVGHWPEYINTWNDYSSAYVEHLLERLRRSKTDTREITVALERKLQEFDTDINSVVHREHQAQAARTIAMSNSIISLKLVGSLDWNDVFEAMSPVDKILSSDLWYKKMDFESRDYYRHRIEDLARRFRTSETRIARKLMNCRQPEAAEPRLAHVGYYLLDKGRAKLFRELGQSPGARWRPGIGSYLLLIVLISFALTWALGLWVFGSLAWRLEILALLLALVPASELAITFVNWVITHSLRPAILPKLEFRDGLPSEAATLVVVPALLTDAKRSRELVEQLAVHYLANPEENLFFALLGDFKDSPDETSAKDQEIIDIVRAGIRELNAKFAPEQDKFFYLHRRREFNNKQGKWMGWERKRGALDELNALLTGSGETSFVVGKDDLQGLKIRYVLTLDADTRLPMDAARLLVGAIAHPLHQAKVERGLVREGYGLIQPRIGVSAESANGSRFARIMVGSGGIDAYTTAVSDLYQDLFGEGIYTGKGIYDVQAYQAVLAGTLPENRVLSHDLLEGSFLRTGLATDLELIDDFPGRYSAYMMRLHRWTRGDWQLLPWLGPHVRDQAGKRRRNPLTLLSRWKIADNLRRSLVPVSLIALFILGLTLLPGILPWLLLPAVTLALPALLALLDRGLMPGRVVGPQSSLLTGPAAAVSQLLLQLAFLPYHAYLMTDAILRTLWRLLVSRRNLLEWTTAADVERTLKNDSASYLRRNRPVLIFVGLSALLFFYIAPLHVIAALPYYALWLLSPLLATWVSGNRRQTQFLEEADIRLLRRLARKIWNYYEDTAGAEANWLPPDNLQIEPPNGIDNRTSPTNIGFLLISALGARDMGYISTTRVTELVDRTLSSVERLEKWHGHLFNWYDTNSLKVLRPRYVSTVDSGNLVAFLIALREGLQEYLEARLVDSRLWKGLGDTAELYAVELPPVGISNHLGDWLNLLADLPEYGVSRLDQMIADFRSEVAELFPHTEILISPPAFLEQSPFAELRILVTALADNPTPLNMCEKYQQIVAECDNLLQQEISSEQQEYLLVLKNDLTVTRENCTRLVERLRTLVERIDTLVAATDFAPLYDNKRHLFSIGYSVEAEKLTDSSYDLLASEARLASYLGIVQRAVPKKHWFKLGRALSRINGQRGLVSWAGTMFEYLMPPLVMKNYANTLLAETYSAVIKAQIEYGHARRIPWGTSESGYYGFDLRLNYQYQAFGIPELGLKRGLINEAVVSPYSTLLALPFAPREALDNIRRLQADDLEGDYGLYEAVDYTPERLPAGEKRGVVRSFMAHHQGMGFVAILNTLLGEIMVRRFHANPQVRAGELLLQERIPTRAIITKENKESVEPLTAYKTPETADYSRHFGRPKTYYPRCHILSNGRYSVLLTDRGTGYSKLDHIQVTRWRDDPLALYGNHILLRNLNNNYSWSACWEPLENRTTYYRARFFPDRAVYIREDDGIDTRTQVTVSTEDNVEVRTVTLANHGLQTVTIELTSYTEPVLTHRAADMAHPGFSNLFVRTKFLPEHNALLASRRPRTPHEQQVHAFHSLTVQGEAVGRIQFESDRSKFLGRTRQINNPAALSQPLTNSEGAVLDPVLSLRRQIRLQPGDTATITIATGIAFSETEIKKLAAKYADTRASERAFALAYTRSQVEARYLNISPDEMKTAQELVAPLLFASSLRRRQQQAIEDNTRSQQALWAYGISGDNPVILVIISEEDELDVLQEVVRAHE
ncbi:MAG: hypothetical protein FH749_02255 [Firmicutes bacterium]|nr:hypothetical protein [Bacillota bacterium]